MNRPLFQTRRPSPTRLDRRLPSTARDEFGGDDMPHLAAIRVVVVERRVRSENAIVEVGEIDADAGQIAEREIDHDRTVNGRRVFDFI